MSPETLLHLSTETLPFACAAMSGLGLLLVLVLLVRDMRRSRDIVRLEMALGLLGRGMGEGFSSGRQENGRNAAELRGEIGRMLHTLGEGTANRLSDLFLAQGQKLDGTTRQIAALTEGNERRQEALKLSVEARLTEIRTESATGVLQLRDEIARTLKETREGLAETLRDNRKALADNLNQMSEAQRERLNVVSKSVADLTLAHKAEQEVLRQRVEGRLDQLRTENSEKLEQMRATVDEKLQKTLHERVSASFAQVSDQLEKVHRSVGEMQTLATGVGDLKRVLTNVKSRGTFGEVNLGALLEETLTLDQYGKNVEIRPASGERVEFAIRLPGQHDDGQLWLPIDCKFPTAEYERLAAAAEAGDAAGVEEASRGLEVAIKASAKTIAGKYVVPPYSTDFAILFLPTEGLYAEIVRRPGLLDFLQREHRILVAGPTTLSALLSSLRMGFRTLAIQKRSSEVWQLPSAVKTEFAKYGESLDKVQQRINQASDEMDRVATRRRAMDRKLRQVDQLPDGESAALLTLPTQETLRLVSDGLGESAA
jgi:DNA recombination protein RmuC